ncbi:MAG: hypothetical protein EHM23_04505 [Acidobacteria bacterium]|nr:MAG: hypothetical protein EHM23_04505 [Acidobacteriota bacterium]
MLGTTYRYLANPSCIPLLEAQRIKDAESLERLSGQGESVSCSSTSEVWRQAWGEEVVYLKRRLYVPPSWRYFGRASRSFCEWRNYEALGRLGCRCPELVCLGEKRSSGQLCWSILVTLEVRHSQNLLQRFQKEQSGAGREQCLSILREVGRTVRLLHQRHFVLRDGKLRNILIAENDEGSSLYFIDCPRGGYRHFFRAAAIRRDLARLGRDVLKTCSQGDWSALLEGYGSIRPEE